jgi:hypothetical protein
MEKISDLLKLFYSPKSFFENIKKKTNITNVIFHFIAFNLISTLFYIFRVFFMSRNRLFLPYIPSYQLKWYSFSEINSMASVVVSILFFQLVFALLSFAIVLIIKLILYFIKKDITFVQIWSILVYSYFSILMFSTFSDMILFLIGNASMQFFDSFKLILYELIPRAITVYSIYLTVVGVKVFTNRQK